jgi:hypothetical protein
MLHIQSQCNQKIDREMPEGMRGRGEGWQKRYGRSYANCISTMMLGIGDGCHLLSFT